MGGCNLSIPYSTTWKCHSRPHFARIGHGYILFQTRTKQTFVLQHAHGDRIQPVFFLKRAQFINTGLLFLLVFGKAPDGYETPQVLKDLSIFAGSYNDFGRDWQVGKKKQVVFNMLVNIYVAFPRLKVIRSCPWN